MRTDEGVSAASSFLSMEKTQFSDFPCPSFTITPACVGKEQDDNFTLFHLRQNSSFELVELLCNRYSHRVNLKESES